MIITTTGFFNTGSSAITHLLKEYSTIGCVDDVYELRLLYDPDGISDLEYHLVENPHRQNSSYAIKRFKKYIDYNTNLLVNHHFEKIFKNNFKEISYKYIENISKFTYYSTSHIDTYDKSVLFCFLNRMYQRLIRLMVNNHVKNNFPDSLLSNKTLQYATIFDKDDFNRITRNYLSNLFEYLINDKGIILIDQLVPPSDFNRYISLLPDNETIRIFVVDRDPRDVYILSKYFLNSRAIPCYDVNVFCDWFMWTREQSRVYPDPKEVLRVQFEDMVYNYDKTVQIIENFCNIDSNYHTYKKKFFDDLKSINNTQTWHRFPKSKNEISIIEQRLKKFLYNFDSYNMKPNYKENNMFDC